MQFLPTDFYQEQGIRHPLKINLFARIHEMAQMTNQLAKITSLPHTDKKVWMHENEVTLEKILQDFADHLPVDLEEEKVDTQTIKLLMEYTTHLKQLRAVVHALLKPATTHTSAKSTTRTTLKNKKALN